MVKIFVHYVLTFFTVILVSHPNFAYGFCTVDGDIPKLSPQEYAEQSDVIFLGRLIKKNSDYKSPLEYEVTEALKGIDKNVRTIGVFKKGVRKSETFPMTMNVGSEDLLLVSAVYTNKERFVHAWSPSCKKPPSAESIISYLKSYSGEDRNRNKIIFLLLAAFLSGVFMMKMKKIKKFKNE